MHSMSNLWRMLQWAPGDWQGVQGSTPHELEEDCSVARHTIMALDDKREDPRVMVSSRDGTRIGYMLHFEAN